MPGSDLSQPASSTEPSSRSACMTVSTESAMTSRDDQREVHALVAHRDAVGHRDGAELQRVAAGRVDAVLDRPWPAGRARGCTGVISFQELATPICGLAKSSSPMPDGAQHPPRGGLLEAVGDVAAAGLDVRRRCCRDRHGPERTTSDLGHRRAGRVDVTRRHRGLEQRRAISMYAWLDYVLLWLPRAARRNAEECAVVLEHFFPLSRVLHVSPTRDDPHRVFVATG